MKIGSINTRLTAVLLLVGMTPWVAGAASFSFTSRPPTSTPAAGQPNDLLTLNIVIDSVTDLSSPSIEGVDWTITYDSTLLLVDADSDITLTGTKFAGATALANRTPGQIIFAIAPTSPPTLVGGDVISAIEFQVRGDATAGLASISLAKIVLNETDEFLNAAQTNVQVVPGPAAGGLLLTALGALGFRAQRGRRARR